MRFTSLKADVGRQETAETLTSYYKSGHSIGSVTLSDDYLFLKKGMKSYYIAYTDADRVFRRVRSLHANICCGDGDIEVESLVVQIGGDEVIEVTLPDKRAARMLMSELRERAPELNTAAPISSMQLTDGENAS